MEATRHSIHAPTAVDVLVLVLVLVLDVEVEPFLQSDTARYYTRPVSVHSAFTVINPRSTTRWSLAGLRRPTRIRLVMLLLEAGHCHQHSPV